MFPCASEARATGLPIADDVAAILRRCSRGRLLSVAGGGKFGWRVQGRHRGGGGREAGADKRENFGTQSRLTERKGEHMMPINEPVRSDQDRGTLQRAYQTLFDGRKAMIDGMAGVEQAPC